MRAGEGTSASSEDAGAAAAVTRRFVAARSELLRRPGLPGPGRRRALVALTDEWLAELYVLAGGRTKQAALVALGGYGRGELSIGSDLDLILVHEGDVGDLAERLWYPIWDSGLRLDHSVRTPAEARRLAARDLKVVLGLLDARPIAGDEVMAARLAGSIRSDWRGLAARRLEELRAAVDERRERQGELAHLLEPDLKESFGGLRDANILRSIAAAWITDIPHNDLEPAVQLLLDTRDGLHLRAARPTDRLLMQEQDSVALALGYADAETLMRAVSMAGRTVGHAADTTWYRVARVTRRSSRRPFRRLRAGRQGRAPLVDGVVVQDDEVVLAADARPERDPTLVLRAAAAAAQAGLHLAPHAVARLAEESAPMPVPWPPAARDALISLLGAGRATLVVWEALDQAGILTSLIPGWDVVRSAPQRNPVHRFTVDRHLVEAAVEASKYQRDVARPDLLLVGALLHDIGKGRPGKDHTEVGVDLVAQIGPHLGFSEEDSAVLVDLVRYHLLLPGTATRRDPDDPATIEGVVTAVGDLETLDLLYALTRADAAATGPAVWSDWRAALIRDLVVRVRDRLTGTVVAPAVHLTDSQRGLLASGRTDVLAEPDGPDGLLRVTVAAEDHVGLLATVAGLLAVHRLDVRAARAIEVDGRALSEWAVHPAFGGRPDTARLREDLRRALAGSLDLTAGVEKREEAYGMRHPHLALEPRVTVFDDASATATVVEVRTYDRPGALYRLASAIADGGLNIAAARADSLGSNVVDVFYLTGSGGGPLDADEIAGVTKRLTEAAAVS